MNGDAAADRLVNELFEFVRQRRGIRSMSHGFVCFVLFVSS